MKGAVLIITLWIMAILAILSIGIGGRIGLELKITGFSRDSSAAFYMAKAGVKRAIAVLQAEDHNVDSLDEQWSNNDEETDPLFKDIKIGEAGSFTVSYTLPDKRVLYGVRDEQRRININNAPGEVMARLIAYLDPTADDPAEIAANIEDWRDADGVRKDGYPEYDYAEEGYKRKDDLFDAVDEVLLVKGMEPALFDKMKEHITVYPAVVSDGKINVNTAPLAVFVALGFSEADAATIMAYRDGDGTSEGVSFEDKNSFTAYLSEAGIPLPAGIALVSCGSTLFRVTSKGYASGGRTFKTVTCVVSGTGGDILFWNEE